MTVEMLAGLPDFKTAAGGGKGREITGIYCCDLLSIVMGRAPADSAWVTVMANVNALGVASLADVACIVLAEGMTLEPEVLAKAEEQEIAVLYTALPIYEAAQCIGAAMA